MARFYYRLKLEGLLAYRGLVKQVDERFHDPTRVQDWYDKITVDAVVTSWKLSLYQNDFNQHPDNGTPMRIKVDEENYLGVDESGKFAKVQDSNAIWYFLEFPDNSILVYYNGGLYYWNWKQVTGGEGFQVGLLQPNELDNPTIRNCSNDPSFKFCSQSLDDCQQRSYIKLYDKQQYIKLNTSDDEILQVEYLNNPPTCDCTNFLFNIDPVQEQQ